MKLGDVVEFGALLGTVCNILGDCVETVYAKEKGTVLVLRTFSRVLEGESLGVIVDTRLKVEG